MVYQDPIARLTVISDRSSDREDDLLEAERLGLIPVFPSDIKLKIETKKLTAYPAPVYVGKRYKELQTLKDRFDTEEFADARDRANPFEKVGRSVFMNRAAIKLANVDVVFQVSGQAFTFSRQQAETQTPFVFVDLCSAPGGFSQYLQFRYPYSFGYGMSLVPTRENGALKYKYDLLIPTDPRSRYTIINSEADIIRLDNQMGKDLVVPHPTGTGNIYKEWKGFVTVCLTEQPEGVDLIVGDGGIEVEGLELHQEQLSSRLITCQLGVAVLVGRVGSDAVIKLFDTVTQYSADLLYLVSLCYDAVYLFKPCTSRPANSERYLVCKGKKQEIGGYQDLFIRLLDSYTDTTYHQQIFASLPEEYVRWLTQWNNRYTEDGLSGDRRPVGKYRYDWKSGRTVESPDPPPRAGNSSG